MKRIVFATNNPNKLREVKNIIGNKIEIVSLADINCFDDIPETQPTIEGNASQKSHYILDKYNIDCFSDDTGLEIEALDGEPGVYSARYAGGKEIRFEDNIKKVLSNLKNKENRRARFKTVVSLILDGKEFFFEGIVNGKIIEEKRGASNFGYDPVFMPDGYDKTFAELTESEKNKISHRGIVIRKLADFLNNL